MTWLNRAKQRALARLERGDVPGAIEVMIETLDKHPDTTTMKDGILREMGKCISASGNVDDALEYIKGFN